jgi:N-acetylglucosaminyl-diphospho-decaprenol L-rhamnosyltransferase
MERTGVVVVSRDSAESLTKLLPRIVNGQTRIVLVDNASRDASVAVAEAAGVPAIVMTTNTGYAVACNHGARFFGNTVDWLAFVNPDVMVAAEDLRLLTEDVPEDIWAISPLTTTQDGTPQADVARTTPTVWFVAAMYLGLTRSKALELPTMPRRDERYYYTSVTSGSCLFVRRECLAEIGGWDEAFFFNGEDIDLCLRVAAAGGRVAVDTTVKIWHQKGHSSSSAQERERSLECARGYATLFQLHNPPWETAVTALTAYVGCLLREAFLRRRYGVINQSHPYRLLRRLLWTTVRQSFGGQTPQRPARPAFLEP